METISERYFLKASLDVKNLFGKWHCLMSTEESEPRSVLCFQKGEMGVGNFLIVFKVRSFSQERNRPRGTKTARVLKIGKDGVDVL